MRRATDDALPLLTAPLASAPSRPSPHRRRRRTTTHALLFGVFVLVSVGSWLYCVETTRLLLPAAASDARPEINTALSLQFFSSRINDTIGTIAVVVPVFDERVNGDLNEYACVAWRQTAGCSPDGTREPAHDVPCDIRVKRGRSGYCEIQHSMTGVRRRVLPTHCTALYRDHGFACHAFSDLLTYGRQALTYTHDRHFGFETNHAELRRQNAEALASVGDGSAFFRHGIVMVVYDEIVLSAYASIRWLRHVGSALPVELWYRRSETDPTNPLLQLLVADYGVYLRELTDPLATGFYTKLHAVFYSAFDCVLLLDADNFAVRDPAYLFTTPEFTSSGAVFWPDYWHPNHTIFNVHRKSLLWQVLDVPFVDMFEQESGQLVIDRRRHAKALNVLMYYGFTLPRIPEELRLVWGDKDLFRLAWLKTHSSFVMIARPPGSAGKMNDAIGAFCGLTMVQHDLHGEILFLHRNMQKLLVENRQALWTHVQQFKRDAPIEDYRIGWAKLFAEFPSCYAKAMHWDELYTLDSMDTLGLGHIEPTLLQFADEGVAILNGTSPVVAGEGTG